MTSIALVNSGVYPSPPPRGGAIELHTYNLANALAELGYEVHYITDISPVASFSRNVIIHKVGYSRGSFHSGFAKDWLCNYFAGWKVWRVVENFLRKEKVDVLHFHHKASGAMYAIKNRSTPVPFVYTVHNPLPSMFNYSVLKQKVRQIPFAILELNLLKSSNGVIAVSRRLKLELAKRYRIEPRKIFFIPNGVDLDVFILRTRELDTITKYGLPESFFLFLGKLEDRKGAKFLLQALKETEGSAVIVGDGPQRNKLRVMTKHLGLEKRVTFTGSVPEKEKIDLYKAASVFVLPSLAEGLPLVVLEALAAGLPIIATQGVADDAILNGYNGFTFPPRNVRLLREKMALLWNDPKLRKQMGQNSRKIAESQFSWRVVAEKVAMVYDHVITNNGNIRR